jgi:hypothetical protein
MAQLIENPPDFACQDLEKKKNKILARFISWGRDMTLQAVSVTLPLPF